MPRSFRCCLLLLVLLSVPMWARCAAPDGDAHVLVLGRISDDPRTHYTQLKALLDYVVPRMADVGIRQGRILMAHDPQQMASYLRRGRVDWVTETAGTGMLLEQRAGAAPLLLTERNGVARYHTLFFTRADSGIDALDDLRGHSIAFQNTSSTSAYMAPVTELLNQHLPLELLLSPRDRPSPGSVGYVFARTELNIASWVDKRLVDVGALSNLDWDDPAHMPPAFRSDLRIIGSSPDYPRALELVRGDLDPRVRARLREVLLQAVDDPEAHQALLLFFKTSRFLPLDDESLQSLQHLRKGIDRIRAEVE